ncbi:DUF3221 domain-containing protein [Chungangia koreensis]|uniref:DUF3221 domain-containing protein n=1 Tax=Chungangia koreensis TaxID=752657 RepID=A0ABV8X5I4_9LACT
MVKRFWLLPLMVLLLAACGTSTSTNGGASGVSDQLSISTEGKTKGEGFIIKTEDHKVLVNDTFFTIDDKTHLVSIGDGGEKQLEFEDLEIGMKVDVYNSGIILTSFPAQGYADIFVVKKDEESLNYAKAFEAFLTSENRKNIVLMGEIEFDEDFIEFNFTDMDTNDSFHASINVSEQTYSLNVLEQ